MKGYIDVCTRELISGWAHADVAEAVELVVEADGEVVGAVRADEYRADLKRACGFRLTFPRPLARPKQVRVYFAGAKVELQNSTA